MTLLKQNKTNNTIKRFAKDSKYLTWKEKNTDHEIVGPLVRQISWTSNVIILKRTKSIEEKELYLRLCIKHNYSSRELNRQISSGYYEWYLLSDGKALKGYR